MAGGRQYQVQHLLGSGGFGSVYLATLVGAGNFSKQVAIKVLKPGAERIDEIAARFRDEARILGLVRHRAIVHVDDLVRFADPDGGVDRWGVVMEYVEGVSLGLLRDQGPIPPPPALEMIEEVASALHAAWSQAGPAGQPLHVVHRDIKPSNLQLSPEGEVKLLDFGISRAEYAHREAQTGALMLGTLTYMAPDTIEHILQGEVCGPEGDIYALGAVLWELLMGEGFVALPKSSREEHQQALFQQMDRLWLRTGEASEPLVQLVADMLHHDPRERPTARKVAQQSADIARQLGGPRLREWAERVVPPLLAVQKTQRGPGPLSGTRLITRFDELTPLPSPPASPASPANSAPPAPRKAAPLPAFPSSDTPLHTGTIPIRSDRMLLWILGGLTTATLIVAGIMAVVLPRLSDSPAPPEPSPPAPPPVTALVVQVRSPEGEPLSGATVVWTDATQPPDSPQALSLDAQGVGEIRLEGDPVSPLHIEASLAGYQQAQQDLSLEAGVPAEVILTLQPTQPSPPQPAAGPPATLMVTVTDAAGQPLAATLSWTGGGSRRLGADGQTSLQIERPPASGVSVRASLSGYAEASQSVRVSAGQTTSIAMVLSPRTSPPPPSPLPAPSPTQILVSGDALAVELRAGQQVFSPGVVPPGTYNIYATFVDREVPAGTVSVQEGQTRRLRCASSFNICE